MHDVRALRESPQAFLEGWSSRGLSDARLADVYAPLGFDIGADSPAEIAISAMAEIIAVLRNRSGAHMRVH